MSELRVDERLDLRGVLCPMNFVKAKLKLEELEPGQKLELHLQNEKAGHFYNATCESQIF